jgi:hypothetical protein
MGLFTVAHAY